MGTSNALRKIDFIGYDRRTVGMRNYDASHWEIFAVVPEPAAYGAILGAAGLGCWQWRKRLRQKTA